MATTTKTLKVVVEMEVEIEYKHYRYVRGARDSLGVPEEPDDLEHVEVLSIRDKDGNEIDEDSLGGGEDFVTVGDQILENLKAEDR